MKNKTYYRTYIFKFSTSSGVYQYAGKHESKFANYIDDPYIGSGIIIKSAVQKYGLECIISKEWFDHQSKDEMVNSEIQLIEHLKEMHGNNCANIAKGGSGGYASEERKTEWNKNRGAARRGKTYPNISIGKLGKKQPNNAIARLGKKQPNISNGLRKSTIWQLPLYRELYNEWSKVKLKHGRFSTHCFKQNVIPEKYNLTGLVAHFERVEQQIEQLLY